MTADSRASSHFIDNRLLPGIEQRMLNYVHLEPPLTLSVAGGYRLSGVGKGVFMVEVEDQQGIKNPVQLPVTIVPGLGRHLFRRNSSNKRSVYGHCRTIIFGLGEFQGQLTCRRKLFYVDILGFGHCSIKHRGGISISNIRK